MKLHTKIILFLAISHQFAMANQKAPYTDIDSANTEYSKGNYNKAIAFYTNFLNDGYESAQVYYNLGNCYYRKSDIPKAILNYEKAKKLNPTDPDVQFNLQLTNLKTTDKIIPDSSLFLTNRWHSFVDIFSEKGWALLSILFLFTGLLLILCYSVAGNLWVRKLSFWSGVILLALSTGAFFLSNEQYNVLTTHDTAIVMSGSVTVKAAPTDNATPLFVVHDGTKVWLVKSEGIYTEIKLANGNQGWLLNSDIEVI